MRGILAAGALLLALSNIATANQNDDVLKCRIESDSLKRLTCYDAIQTTENNDNKLTSEPGAASTANIVTTDITLRRQGKDYKKQVYNSRIEAIPTFKNNTKKTLVAVELTMSITDAFGEKIVDGKDKLDIKIAPGKSQQSKMFFYWEDNPFIPNEPYDKLSGPVDTGVAKAEMKVIKAVFSDGTVEEYEK